MKKNICLLVTAVAAGLCAAAQDVTVLPSDEPMPAKPLRWGVRLQADISLPTGSLDTYTSGAGASGGVVYHLPLYGGMYFEPSVMGYYNTFSVENYMVNNLPHSATVRNIGIRVPMNLGYRFNITDGISLSLFTGPWFNFNISARQYAQPNFEGAPPKSSKNLFDYGWHRFDAQWGFGVTATFSGRYVIGISGGVGSSALVKRDVNGKLCKMRRNSFSVTLGYNF